MLCPFESITKGLMKIKTHCQFCPVMTLSISCGYSSFHMGLKMQGGPADAQSCTWTEHPVWWCSAEHCCCPCCCPLPSASQPCSYNAPALQKQEKPQSIFHVFKKNIYIHTYIHIYIHTQTYICV